MRKNIKRRRGQAMVEYSVVTFILAVGALGVLSIPIGNRRVPLLRVFWDQLNLFYDSIYYVLQCSVP